MEINYSYIEGMIKSSNSVASELSNYATNLTNNVSDKFKNVTGEETENLTKAKYYVDDKIKKLNKKSAKYAAFANALTNFETFAKDKDTDVANHIESEYTTFIGKHPKLAIDPKRAEQIAKINDARNNNWFLDLVLTAHEDLWSGLEEAGDAIKHWYECEGGKEIGKIVLAVAGVIVAVAIVIASFPVSGIFAVLALIGAIIGAVNAAVNLGTSIAALVAKKTENPAWSHIFLGTDTAADGLRLWRTDSKTFNRLSFYAATTIEITEVICAVATVFESFGKIGKYLNEAGNIAAYFKTPVWKNGKILADENGVVKTRVTLKSIWRGTKSFVCNKQIAANDTRGIRTIFFSNIGHDIASNFKYNFNPKNSALFNLFSKDSANRARAVRAISSDFKHGWLITTAKDNKSAKTIWKNYQMVVNAIEAPSKIKDTIIKNGIGIAENKFGEEPNIAKNTYNAIKKAIKVLPNNFNYSETTGVTYAY